MNSYTFDISLTNDCNFQCVYCIERGYFKPEYLSLEKAKIICEKLKGLYTMEYFKSIGIEKYVIGLWGGEPTLNMQVIKYIIQYFIDCNIPVEYRLFTNAYLLDENMLNYIEDLNKNDITFEVQISYDGGVLQEKCRISNLLNDKNTLPVIRDRIKTIAKYRIPFHLKSTVSFKYFKYLYEAYLDIYNLSKEINKHLNHTITIDYSPQTMQTLDMSLFEEYKKDLELSLLQIAKKELEFLNKGEKNIFTWFDPNDPAKRALCGAGYRFFTIDIYGNLITCHGCEYSNAKTDHIFCNVITNNVQDIETALKERDVLFEDVFSSKYDCNNCDVIICYRCNSIKYDLSNKDTYKEKWLDFTNQPYLCDIYKMVSNIYRILLLKIQDDTVKV